MGGDSWPIVSRPGGAGSRIWRQPAASSPRPSVDSEHGFILAGHAAAANRPDCKELKKHYGLGRAKYLGLAKMNMQLMLSAMAFNLKKAALMMGS